MSGACIFARAEMIWEHNIDNKLRLQVAVELVPPSTAVRYFLVVLVHGIGWQGDIYLLGKRIT